MRPGPGRAAATLRSIDEALLRGFRTRGHWPPAERAVGRFSRLGEHSMLWFGIALMGVAADARRRPVHVRLATTVALVEVLNALAKLAVGRPRPRFEALPPLTSTNSQLSCPSAHSSTSFAAARVLSAGFPARCVYPVAAAMALSRPYLGVHYPSDVVAGMAFGTALGQCARRGLPPRTG